MYGVRSAVFFLGPSLSQSHGDRGEMYPTLCRLQAHYWQLLCLLISKGVGGMLVHPGYLALRSNGCVQKKGMERICASRAVVITTLPAR